MNKLIIRLLGQLCDIINLMDGQNIVQWKLDNFEDEEKKRSGRTFNNKNRDSGL